ncbi:MAG: TatD family hydrolase [archaeon]|nr:TatD family hydrolase [archaeon]MCR4323715.1 TatD family hydrolase [Nanoarchaeota archaeon]
MNLIDVHAHLGFERFNNDLDEVIERARKANLKLIITSGIGPKTNRQALEIVEKYLDIVKASFGIYPVDAIASKVKNISDDVKRDIEEFDVDEEIRWIEGNKDKCIAIGEVGLDYKVVPGTEELQKEVFRKIIQLAKKIDKPLVIHSRNAEADCINLLEEARMKKVVMHCFSGKKHLIRKGIELGFFFSVPPVITRLQHFKTLVEIVPLTQLLTETDAPYLSPVAGTRNEPANVVITIKEIAKIKNLSEKDVADQIYKNAETLFKI